LSHLAVPEKRIRDQSVDICALMLVEKAIQDRRDYIGYSDFKVLMRGQKVCTLFKYLDNVGVPLSVNRFHEWMIFFPSIQYRQRIILARIPNLISQKDTPKDHVSRLFNEIAIDLITDSRKLVFVIATGDRVSDRINQRSVHAPPECARFHVLDVAEIPVAVCEVVHG
jgi:hypothetical protein